MGNLYAGVTVYKKCSLHRLKDHIEVKKKEFFKKVENHHEL